MQVRLSNAVSSLVAKNAIDNGRSIPKELEVIIPLYYKNNRGGSVSQPGFVKAQLFKDSFPYSLECNEFKVKWPIRNSEWKTYNPDFYCKKLDIFVECCTSWPNYSECRIKWLKILNKHKNFKIFWWEGQDITEFVRKNTAPSVLREKLKL